MIQQNKIPEHNQKVGRRKSLQQARQYAHQRAQITINAVLWQIIRQNAEAGEEDFDTALPAMLTVPKEDFKAVPEGFGLQVKHDKEGNIIIVASGVETKSDLILPDNKVIEG